MNMIQIDGVSLPPVTTYRVTLSDADGSNSGRAENAVMTRDRVRENIVKIELGWTCISTDEMSSIINRVTPAEFSVRYFFGTMHDAVMYAGDKTIELKVTAGEEEAYWNMSVNLVEY